MSIDRFHPFSDEELHELRFGLFKAGADYHRAWRLDCQEKADKLADEIGHVQEQRRMAAARALNPG